MEYHQFCEKPVKKKVADNAAEPAGQAEATEAPAVAAEVTASENDTTVATGKIRLALGFDEDSKTIYARAFRIENDKRIPTSGVPVEIAVKRYFRDLRLSEAGVLTDVNGYVSAVFPEDLPADTAGNVVIIARIPESEQEEFGMAVTQQTKTWGIKLIPHNIKDARSLWNDNHKLPLWLLFSYLAAVSGALVTFAYILSLVWKIYKIGKSSFQA